MTSRARLLLGVVLMTFVPYAPVVRAQPKTAPFVDNEARQSFSRGLSAYDAGRYEDAIAAFHATYDREPRRDVLFAWAQAERLSGDCPSAVALYRKFLSFDPPPAEAERAAQQLARCEQALATRPPASSTPVGPAPLGPSAQPVPSQRTDPTPAAPAWSAAPATSATLAPPIVARAPFYHDVVGDILVGAGAIGIAVGSGFLVASRASRSSATSAATYGDYVDERHRVDAQRVDGVILLSTGGVFLAIGVVKYLLTPGRPHQPSPAATPTP